MSKQSGPHQEDNFDGHSGGTEREDTVPHSLRGPLGGGSWHGGYLYEYFTIRMSILR